MAFCYTLVMIKKKHKSPKEYRVNYVLNQSSTPSTNYYSVFQPSDALIDLLYFLNKKDTKGGDINILSIEERCPYTQSWKDQTDEAIENLDSDSLTLNSESIQLNNHIVTDEK